MFAHDQNDFNFANDFMDDSDDEIALSQNFKSQTTKLPFHSSLGTDFLNLFAAPGS